MIGSADAMTTRCPRDQGRDNLVDAAILAPRLDLLDAVTGGLETTGRQGRFLVAGRPVPAKDRSEDKRIGSHPSIRPMADKNCVKRQCPGPAAVIAALGKHPDDHPGPTWQSDGEETVSLNSARWGLAKPLRSQPQRVDPLSPAPCRPGQHRVPSIPEREAAVDRLLIANAFGPHPERQCDSFQLQQSRWDRRLPI